MEAPTPAKMAAAKAAEMAAAQAPYVATAKAAHMAEVSAGEMSPAAMERDAISKAVVEMTSSKEDRTAKAKAAVIGPVVAIVPVVAPAIRP